MAPALVIWHLTVVFLFCVFTVYSTFGPGYQWFGAVQRRRQPIGRVIRRHGNDTAPEEVTVDLVVASTTRDNTSWVWDVLPDWNKKVYVVDNPNATFTVPADKGNEAMVYLTYVLDHYDNLPDVMVFQHASRYQWHNDDPLYDGARVLERLRLGYVQYAGYASLRCNWRYGCPVEAHPIHDEDPGDEDAWKAQYKLSFETLFPAEDVPEAIGATCCAQFAVTRERALRRPRESYERIRQWIINTELESRVSGRVLEKVWHILFGAPALTCPEARQCYCDTFGLCQLECGSAGECAAHYTTPKTDPLPDTWPAFDRKGRPNNLANVEIIS